MKVAVFKIGRGGMFNNPGHLKFNEIVDGPSAEYFGYNVYQKFENWEYFISLLEDDEIEYDYILDWAADFQGKEEEKIIFNDWCKERDIDFSFEQLGDIYIYNEVGNSLGCTLEEYQSDTCTLNFDNDNDTLYWIPISELNEEEVLAILKSEVSYEYEYLLEDEQKAVYYALKELDFDKKTIANSMAEKHSFDDLVKLGLIQEVEGIVEYKGCFYERN
jgi:hypothetical protein